MTDRPTLYHYDRVTGLLQGTSLAEADGQDPGVFLAPAFSTHIAPPDMQPHQAAVFNGTEWTAVPDWRGHTYWLADRTEHTIAELGVEPPAEALDKLPPAPLGDVKQEACALINSTAEATRLLFLTPGSGQAMTYQAKEAEAHALAQDANPDPANYPMLSAMIGLDGDTLEEVGETIRLRASQWAVIGAEIERIRQTAKQAVNVAETHEEIETILDGLTWPEPI